MPEHSETDLNARRAGWARAALAAFAAQTRQADPADLDTPDAFKEVVTDLLCGLRHLRDVVAPGVDLTMLDVSAYSEYVDERREAAREQRRAQRADGPTHTSPVGKRAK